MSSEPTSIMHCPKPAIGACEPECTPMMTETSFLRLYITVAQRFFVSDELESMMDQGSPGPLTSVRACTLESEDSHRARNVRKRENWPESALAPH